MRSWSTFNHKNSWNDLQNKPSILTDNQVNWNEILNKPTGQVKAIVNFGNGLDSINFLASSVGGDSGQISGYSFYTTFSNYPDTIVRRSADIWSGFDYIWGSEYLAFGVGKWGGNDLANVTDEKMRLSFDGTLHASNFRAISIPNTSSGLTTGNFYRDLNGFVKVVI